MSFETAPHIDLEDALRRVAELEGALTSMTEALTTTAETLSKTSAALASVTAERDKLRHAYEQLKGQLEFAETKAKLDKLAKELGTADLAERASDNETSSGDGDGPPTHTKKEVEGTPQHPTARHSRGARRDPGSRARRQSRAHRL